MSQTEADDVLCSLVAAGHADVIVCCDYDMLLYLQSSDSTVFMLRSKNHGDLYAAPLLGQESYVRAKQATSKLQVPLEAKEKAAHASLRTAEDALKRKQTVFFFLLVRTSSFHNSELFFMQTPNQSSVRESKLFAQAKQAHTALTRQLQQLKIQVCYIIVA